MVTVAPDPFARFVASCALAIAPAGFVLAWATTSAGEIAESLWPSRFSVAASVALGVLLFVALLRGTARAQIFSDGELIDSVQWSLRPPRALVVSFETHKLEATISTGGEREVSFSLDGAAVRTVKIQ